MRPKDADAGGMTLIHWETIKWDQKKRSAPILCRVTADRIASAKSMNPNAQFEKTSCITSKCLQHTAVSQSRARGEGEGWRAR